jgi:hypothetical protein
VAVQRIAFLLMAALLLFGGRTDAQPAPWQPERTSAGWTFTPGAVFGAAWDSNVTVQGAGDPITKEWVGLLNPRGELDYNGRRTHFNLGYSGSLEKYRRFDELDRYDQRGRLELRHQASERVGLFGRGSLSVSPTTDRLDIGNGSIPFIDIGSQLLAVTGGSRITPGPRANIELTYRFQDVRFDQEDPRAFALLQGGYSHTPGATFMYGASRRFAVGASWQYQHARIADGLQTFDLQTAAAEAAYRVAEATTIRGGGGLSYVHATNGNLSSVGPAVHAGIEHNRGRTTLGMRFERAFTPTYTFGGITTNQTLSGNVRVSFARDRGYVSGGLAHGRTDPVEQLDLDFRTDSVWVDGAIGYSVTRWLRAEAFYNGSHQTSTARGNIDRTRVGVQFVTFKPMRIE